MASQDPRVDAYIDTAAPFAQPILREIRVRLHTSCDGLEEAIKWGMPGFMYRGKILCVMAAFKAHATLAFWRRDEQAPKSGNAGEAMGEFGRLTQVKDLPGKRAFAVKVKEAMQRIEAGVPQRVVKPRAPVAMTPAFAQALAQDTPARTVFDGFSAGYQRDYLEWIGEAKTEATRDKRIAQALEWLAEGKHRNWKYEK
ncbi:YdeI/OmpD-associated family protein [Pseudoxanthomonas sp.]|uniref:YdeI/OmpD-associated family protein n=1 Tax=Pseudoxanthomonas sp. TaxID=1871049 RepID=UPI00262C1273|nr:YdeI/OmpD-associated family protein [Pseudoxanthomonas sp.]WDS35383.1 MAG: YdeI/OmpD-associated family protein [Pseudoxanthomonas sp.]